LTLAVAAPAAGQEENAEKAGFPVERLRPSMDRNGILDVESASVGDHLDYDVALWGSYALNPLTLSRRLPDGTVERAGIIVGHRVGAFLVGGVSLFDVAQIGAELPIVLLQLRGAPPADRDAVLNELNAVGVGDLRVIPKLSVTRWIERFADVPRVVEVSLIPAFTVPSGFPPGAYMGEGFFTFAPEIAASTKIAGLKVGANAGMRFRPESQFLGLNVSHELTYRLGVGYDLRDTIGAPFDFGASLTGATALLTPFAEINQNPLEMLAGGTWDAWGPVQVFGGLGFGLIAGFGTPDARLFAGVRYSPRSADKDGDGILDARRTAVPTSRVSCACRAAPRTTATATASSTRTTSVRTTPRTPTASRTRTAARIPTTTATACSTPTMSAPTRPRIRTASPMRTAARTRTTTRTVCSTAKTSAPTRPRTSTATPTPMAARTPTTTKTACPTPRISAPTNPRTSTATPTTTAAPTTPAWS
jgi:hypothetical protein